jgi:hypothetical protein
MFETIITSLFSAMFGAIFAIAVARYSKTKEERAASSASDWIKIADMTGDQLEKKINQIAQLEVRIDKQDALISELKTKNEDLARENNNLNARITKIQLEETERERVETERSKAIADLLEAMWDYIKTLIDALREHEIDIPPRPDKLKNRETLEKIRSLNFPIRTDDPFGQG